MTDSPAATLAGSDLVDLEDHVRRPAEKKVLSARGFKRVGKHSEYSIY
jgi:hypothetical protein